MRAHEPELVARLRVIARTPATPIPPLVGAPGMHAADAARLRDALLVGRRAPELAAVRETLLLRGFAPVAPEAYDALRGRRAARRRAGLPAIA